MFKKGNIIFIKSLVLALVVLSMTNPTLADDTESTAVSESTNKNNDKKIKKFNHQVILLNDIINHTWFSDYLGSSFYINDFQSKNYSHTPMRIQNDLYSLESVLLHQQSLMKFALNTEGKSIIFGNQNSNNTKLNVLMNIHTHNFNLVLPHYLIKYQGSSLMRWCLMRGQIFYVNLHRAMYNRLGLEKYLEYQEALNTLSRILDLSFQSLVFGSSRLSSSIQFFEKVLVNTDAPYRKVTFPQELLDELKEYHEVTDWPKEIDDIKIDKIVQSIIDIELYVPSRAHLSFFKPLVRLVNKLSEKIIEKLQYSVLNKIDINLNESNLKDFRDYEKRIAKNRICRKLFETRK